MVKHCGTAEMDMNSTYTPPINNLCVPDIYNRLDAEVIERTRVANNQLNVRLSVEQKIISKYRQSAERFLLLEKSRIARDLSRITQTLPAVTSIRDFDEKFRHGVRSGPIAKKKRKRKRYLTGKDDNPICQRCYIHHMPSKKNFYRRETPSPEPSIFETKSSHATTNGRDSPENKDASGSRSPNHQTQLATDDDEMPISEPDGSTEVPVSTTHTQHHGKVHPAKFIPPAQNFKFLERDSVGREQDLNQSLTPRLMPNEMWKTVVKDICDQCLSREKKYPAPLNRRGSRNLLRERTFERKFASKNRKASISIANAEPLLTSLSNSNTRTVSMRRASIASNHESQNDSKSPSRLMTSLSRANSKPSLIRPSVARENSPGHSSQSIIKRKNSKLVANKTNVPASNHHDSVNRVDNVMRIS